ncbi:MAG: hypothetical protein U9N34_10540 [Candidatus Cloacimonadota bacterium]|nr:hypothetical protein [Candidatus Cloacimonadota bacterium]
MISVAKMHYIEELIKLDSNADSNILKKKIADEEILLIEIKKNYQIT